jgi:hypothetical protein
MENRFIVRQLHDHNETYKAEEIVKAVEVILQSVPFSACSIRQVKYCLS